MIITNNSDLHHAWLSTHHGCTVDFGPVLSQDLLVCCLNLFAASHDDSSFCRLSFKVHIYSKITFEVFIIDNNNNKMQWEYIRDITKSTEEE